MEFAKAKPSHRHTPIEKHESAAWITPTEKAKPISNVHIPHDTAVVDAKEWGEANQK